MPLNVEYLPYKFEPRPYQAVLMHELLVKNTNRAIISWHRRSGKDKTCWIIMLIKALQRKGNYFYIFPTAKQGRKALWTAIDSGGVAFLDHLAPSIINKINNTEMRINLVNGSTIQIVGASHYNYVVGTNPVGMVFSEYSLQTPLAFSYLSPAAVENKGWIILNTTPRGHNHAYRLFQHALGNDSWYVDKRDVLETLSAEGERYISDSDLETAAGAMSIEKFQQEFFCDWSSALENSYFSNYLRKARSENRIGGFPLPVENPLYTAWDLGFNDQTAIWFFYIKRNGEITFVHYYENNQQAMEHYINYVKKFGESRGLVFARHFAPHDICHADWSTGEKRIHRAQRLGFTFTAVPRSKDKMDQIEYSRALFKRYHFDEKECRIGLDALMEYHARENLNTGARGGPFHDWSSNGSDAFMIVAQAYQAGLMPELGYSKNPMTPQMNSFALESVIG